MNCVADNCLRMSLILAGAASITETAALNKTIGDQYKSIARKVISWAEEFPAMKPNNAAGETNTNSSAVMSRPSSPNIFS